MAFTAPVGVIPIDRKPPSSPTYADIPKVLDWLRDSYGGHTVIGLLITDRQQHITYRIDAESAYTAYADAGPRGVYTLTAIGGGGIITGTQTTAVTTRGRTVSVFSTTGSTSYQASQTTAVTSRGRTVSVLSVQGA